MVCLFGHFFFSRRHPLNHREIRMAIRGTYVANPSLSCIYDMTTLAHTVAYPGVCLVCCSTPIQTLRAPVASTITALEQLAR